MRPASSLGEQRDRKSISARSAPCETRRPGPSDVEPDAEAQLRGLGSAEATGTPAVPSTMAEGTGDRARIYLQREVGHQDTDEGVGDAPSAENMRWLASPNIQQGFDAAMINMHQHLKDQLPENDPMPVWPRQ